MRDRELLIGVTGGVASYKTAALVSQLRRPALRVRVVMTQAARAFVGPATFTALTGRPAVTEPFDAAHPLGAHIELARQAELLCVAPATANFLAKAACGLADDLLSTLLLSCTCPVLLAPAMNCEMWDKPSVQRNVARLRDDGFHFVGPEEGWLSCRQVGPGRMASPEAIFAAIAGMLTGGSTNV